MKKCLFVIISIFALVAMTTGSADGAPFQDPYGILPASTFDTNNPATGQPWQDGDQYRMVFITSERSDAESDDIETYNTWVQGLADASTAYNLGQASWSVIGSTATVDARDNTLTNPSVSGFGDGHPIYKLDGTLVAADFVDLWDGSIQSIIDIAEDGGAPASTWPIAGTALDGTASGQFGPLGSGGDVQQGNSNELTQWIWRGWTGSASQSMYAMSDPIPEPAMLSLLVLGGVSALVRRERRK